MVLYVLFALTMALFAITARYTFANWRETARTGLGRIALFVSSAWMLAALITWTFALVAVAP